LHALGALQEDHAQLAHIASLADSVSRDDPSGLDTFLLQLRRLAGMKWTAALDRGLEIVFSRWSQRDSGGPEANVDGPSPERLAELYTALPLDARARGPLLGWLAGLYSREALETYARLIADDPPECEATLLAAFAPLADRRREFEVDAVFPQILGGLKHRSVAAAILDIANFLTRERRVEVHPAAAQAETLDRMLGLLVQQLELIESGKVPGNRSPSELSRMVNDSVALITALCDALALIGHPAATDNLGHAAGLRHRRVRAEALAEL
jgi:hypothetical protein